MEVKLANHQGTSAAIEAVHETGGEMHLTGEIELELEDYDDY